VAPTNPDPATLSGISLSRRLRLADTNTRCLAALDVHGRIAVQLLAFAREYGEPISDAGVLIPLRLTQTDLGGLVGASRVRVNQVLGYYRKRCYISLDKEGRIIAHLEQAFCGGADQNPLEGIALAHRFVPEGGLLLPGLVHLACQRGFVHRRPCSILICASVRAQARFSHPPRSAITL
jgi:Crp-like helix-turn-helix domain